MGNFNLIFVILLIGAFLFLVIGIIAYFAKRKKKKKESELGIFHHPSNFKKAPVEWVQKPKDSETDISTKKL